MYLEGMEEASIFVHVAVNDITGKVGTPQEERSDSLLVFKVLEMSSASQDKENVSSDL